MSFDVGALVKVRGREWVVLPESNDEPDIMILRPPEERRTRSPEFTYRSSQSNQPRSISRSGKGDG